MSGGCVVLRGTCRECLRFGIECNDGFPDPANCPKAQSERMTAERLLDPLIDQEEFDHRMREAQDAIRAGNAALAGSLLAAFRDPGRSVSDRGVALETVACARYREIEPLVFEAIREGLGAADSDLRFAAVACASDLSAEARALIRPEIESLAAQGGAVGRAAKAFLGRMAP